MNKVSKPEVQYRPVPGERGRFEIFVGGKSTRTILRCIVIPNRDMKPIRQGAD